MSNYTDARDAYLANADYSETSSTTKAAAFVTACRKLILLAPSESAFADSRTKLDENLRQWREEINSAQTWQSSQGAAGSGVVHTSFDNFRDY